MNVGSKTSEQHQESAGSAAARNAGSWEETLDREIAGLVRNNDPVISGLPTGPTPTTPPDEHSAKEDGRSVSIRELRMEFLHSIQNSLALPMDICDDSGQVLLEAGSQITARFLQTLRSRGIKRVRLRNTSPGPPETPLEAPDASPADSLHTQQSRQLDDRLAGELEVPVATHPVKAWRRPRLPIDALKEEAHRGVAKHQAASQAVADLCDALKTGQRVSTPELQQTVSHFVDKAAIDFDLLPLIVAMQSSKGEYLYDHCVNTALIAMAMGTHLGLERDKIEVVGLGAMLQDVGMLRVPESIRLGNRPLGQREWLEIHRHPLHTLDMIADMRGLPSVVRFMVYQAHERANGGGYPRGRSRGQIHQFAQILSIADSYAAMTRDRPHRRALSPYVAARTILYDGADARFDHT